MVGYDIDDRFWREKVKAFLHDPPDKALILGSGESHEEVAKRIWEELGLIKEDYTQKVRSADHTSSSIQRVNLYGTCEVYFTQKIGEKSGRPLIKHTLSGNILRQGEESYLERLIRDSGIKKLLLRENKAAKSLFDYIRNSSLDWKQKYFLLWQTLPSIYSLGFYLPADTRIPDHCIWDHLDVTSAIFSSLYKGEGISLLAIKLPGVQEFISQSRKLSDLWSSSHMFSTIIFEGIKAIAEELGPDAIIYPHLRDNPMFLISEFSDTKGNKFSVSSIINDFINNLRDDSSNLKEVIRKSFTIATLLGERMQYANFPNVFLALVPTNQEKEYSQKVENAIKKKLKEISDSAYEKLADNGIRFPKHQWDSQINSSIKVTAVWIPLLDLNKIDNIFGNKKPKEIEEDINYIKSSAPNQNPPMYSTTYRLLGTMLTQASRLWNAWEEEPRTGKKCLMCGRRSAIIERKDNEYYEYYYWDGSSWNKKVELDGKLKNLLKDGERLCAVCLMKRLYGFHGTSLYKEALNKGIQGIKAPEWYSVVHVAASDFLKKVRNNNKLSDFLKDKDVELVYEEEFERFKKKKGNEELKDVEEQLNKLWKESKPNKYYSILMIDGDKIGEMLTGERLYSIDKFLHENCVEILRKSNAGFLKNKRLLTPSHHIAISRAMRDFSIYTVPEIVKRYDGFLVYSGGDDVLALFPSNRVLEAAYEIQEHFKKEWYNVSRKGSYGIYEKKLMGLGSNATMSAGIVFAHYKWPFYDVIESAREAEKKAKDTYGRNAFFLKLIKHSGQIIEAGGKWNFVGYIKPIMEALVPSNQNYSQKNAKLSHSFIYDLIDYLNIFDDKHNIVNYKPLIVSGIKRLLQRRMVVEDSQEVQKLSQNFSSLIEHYIDNGLPIKDIGYSIKILFDAYVGER